MVDRIEWHYIPDPQQAINALLAGEIDFIEGPPIDLYPLLKASPDVALTKINEHGSQYQFRPNWRNPPFDKPNIRKALWFVLNQEDFLSAFSNNPDYYTTCKSIWICGSKFSSSLGFEGRLTSDFATSKKLLLEAGYDGTPIIILQAADLQVLGNLAPVAKSLLEKAGFKVELRSMDWQSLVARVNKYDGWHVFLTLYTAADLTDPLVSTSLNAACEKARTGWPCDAKMEDLRSQFAVARDEGERRRLAHEIQLRALDITTHIPLGQIYYSAAFRRNITGIVSAPVTVFWGMQKR